IREPPECPLHELRMCDASAWLSECRLHVAAEMRSREDSYRTRRRSGSSAPVFDAVVVGCEAVTNAPQNRLGAAGDLDLAVDGSDVGLDGVRAEMGQGCHLGVAVALSDQG